MIGRFVVVTAAAGDGDAGADTEGGGGDGAAGDDLDLALHGITSWARRQCAASDPDSALKAGNRMNNRAPPCGLSPIVTDPAVRVDELGHDREPETAPALVARPRVVETHESVEHTRRGPRAECPGRRRRR